MAVERAAVTWERAGTVRDPQAGAVPGRSGNHRGRSLWTRRPSVGGAIGLGIVLLLIVVALVGPLVVRVDPARQELLGRLAPPVWLGGGAAHPLGTDEVGRDLLARVVAGARVSLLVGLTATLLAGTIGVALGLAAGYAGGVVDRVVSWVVDVHLAIPFVVVAIAVTAVLGNGLGNVLLVLVITGWVGYARVVRLQTRALREAPYVEAARALGASWPRQLGRHVLPNLIGSVVVLASQQVAAMILYEAALSYLGLGVPGDVVTWGGMVAGGRDALLSAWWVSAIPGVAIALTVLGFNLLGDWLGEGRQ